MFRLMPELGRCKRLCAGDSWMLRITSVGPDSRFLVVYRSTGSLTYCLSLAVSFATSLYNAEAETMSRMEDTRPGHVVDARRRAQKIEEMCNVHRRKGEESLVLTVNV